MIEDIRAKLLAGERLDRKDGHWLLADAPLLEVGALADTIRFRRIPERRVTFVIDSNPNYTNVCITDCQFCAFYRKPGDPEAWTLSVDEVLAKVEFAASKGATTVLLQGGHNPELPLDYYLTIVRETLRRFPHVTPHFFTASEIQTVAKVSGLAMTEVLDRLKDAGQRTLPGGGAEVLSERVRKRIEPKKGGPDAWREGKRAGQIALRFGADDWGETGCEENVHRAADYVNAVSVEEIVTLIREAGFTPAQRDTECQILRTY